MKRARNAIFAGARKSSLRQHRRIAVVATAIAALVTALGVSAPAFASTTHSTSSWAHCSKDWTTNKYGGTAEASLTWNHESVSPGSFNVLTYDAGVSSLEDCGPSGSGLKGYKIVTSITITITGSKITSCDGGFPSGFTCHFSPTQLTYTHSHTCEYNVSSCSISGGPFYFYPSSGGILGPTAPTLQETATIYGSGGNDASWQTSRLS